MTNLMPHRVILPGIQTFNFKEMIPKPDWQHYCLHLSLEHCLNLWQNCKRKISSQKGAEPNKLQELE